MEKKHNWHSLTNAELEREFRSDSATGITDAEAARRLRHQKNTIWEVKNVSVGKYIASSMLSFTTVLLLLTVLAAAFFGRSGEALTVCAVVILCRIVRVAVYMYAQRTLEDNSRAALPVAKVVRSGNVKELPADRIVVGDVIIIDAGDTVPCDIRLTAADNVMVSETSVTDKEGIISKNSKEVRTGANHDVPLSLRTNMLYATSTVVGGFGIGIAVATGKDTLVCAREGSVVIPGGEDMPLMEKLSEWTRVCSLSLMIAAFVITVLGIFVGNQSFFGIFLPSVSMAAACMSEFLTAVCALAWSESLKKEKNGSEVYKNVSTAETAAHADVLMFRSAEIFKSRKITLHSYYKDSKLKLIGTKGAEIPSELLALACYCTGTTPAGSISKGSFGQGVRQTSVLPYDVVRTLWEENGDKKRDPRYTIVGHITAGEENSDGFDSSLLALGDRFYYAMTGRPAGIIGRCNSYKSGNTVHHLDEETRKKVLSYAAALKKHGVTVCAVAKRESPYNNMRRANVLASNLCFEGFIAVSDRMEEGAAERIARYRGEGGRVVIFSDVMSSDGEEDKLFCESEGVFRTGDLYLEEKESVKTQNLPTDPGTLTMIRTPAGAAGIRERLRFISLLREAGLKVAYVGYGVEDVWSVQRSDVSYAVPDPQSKPVPQSLRISADGISETKAGGVLSVFRMMDRCRSALYNIRNILTYLLMSHVARLILMIICAVSSFPVMNATHLVFWGFILDFFTVIAITKVPSWKNKLTGEECELPDDKTDVFYPTITGALCALVATAAPFLGRAIIAWAGKEVNFTQDQMVLCMMTSCILAMPLIAAEYSGKKGLFSSDSEYGKLFWVPFATAVFGTAFALLSPIVGIAFPGWLMCTFLLIPGLFVVVLMSVIRAMGNDKDNKENVNTKTNNK